MAKEKKVKNLIGYNFKTLISFELVYKLATLVIFLPMFLWIFKLIMKGTGYSYLTFENVIPFLTKPITLIMLLLLFLIITFYTLIDISTVIVILDSSYQQVKISIKEALIIACQKAIKVFKIKNISLIFLVLFLIPFMHIGLSSGVISTIKIPEFIMDYIVSNKMLSILYSLLILFFSFLILRWIYAIHYFVLEDLTFKEACQKSAKLNEKSKIKDYLKIALMQLGIAIFYFVFILLGIFLIILFYKILGKASVLSSFSITLIWLLIAFSFIIAVLLATPISYACITILFYKHKGEHKEKIKHIKINSKELKNNKKFKIFKYSILVVILVVGTIFTYEVLNKKISLNIEYERIIEVTAHRGASAFYPENTMSSFYGAKEAGADWIELDVQQTKDKKLIVLHDTNLKRTTGVNKNTWEVTYDEVAKLDAGSFFDKKYHDEKIPLLAEVIKFAKENGMKLNIELKPTGKEKNFEKDVVNLIKEYDFENNCVITSQVYEVLENVKKYSKDVKTVYVMSLAYGDILDLKAADNFSIEASSVKKKLVNDVHKANKELYVWTVNTKESIEKMVEMNVDNIITDDINLARKIILERKTGNIINEYFKLIVKLFN